MAFTDDRKDEFVAAYTQVLLASWSDDAYANRLDENPRSALAEAGLFLPEGVAVQITRADTASDDPADFESQSTAVRLERQVQRYVEGLRTGLVVLHIPETPQIDTSELDLDELDEVAAGVVSCCCCPCCCCG
ncbi:hypothetical protein [Demetria terragena]|uniref:hypothetical protein n=1 Tax=Demetria terragena TaxID=63959 RepID=UPI00039C4B5F|nr:hypothetical protein [Demetria terragena]